MVSDIKFPNAPKEILISDDFKSYFEKPKGPSRFDKFLKNVFDAMESEPFKTASFLSRIVTTVFSIKRSTLPEDASRSVINAAKESHNIAQSIGDVLTIISGAGAVASLIRNLKKRNVKREDQPIRKLEMFRSILQIITTGTTFVTILDRFKAIELASITRGMGAIPVIGQGLAQALPASVVFAGLSIATNVVTITISALKLQKIAARIDRINEKKQLWNQPIDGTFAEKKIARIVTKQQNVVQKATDLKTEIEKMESALKNKGQNYHDKKAELERLQKELETTNKVSGFMRTFKERSELITAKKEYKKEVKQYKLLSTEMKSLEKDHKIRLEKGKKWEAIHAKFDTGSITEEDTDALKKMQAAKLAKWKTKKTKELIEVAKEATKIGLTLISIAISVAMIALIIIYTGNIPAAALITVAAVGLSLAAVNLGRSFCINRIKRPPPNSVAIPNFRELQAVE